MLLGVRITVKGVKRDTMQGDIAFLQVLEQMGGTLQETKDGIALPSALRMHAELLHHPRGEINVGHPVTSLRRSLISRQQSRASGISGGRNATALRRSVRSWESWEFFVIFSGHCMFLHK